MKPWTLTKRLTIQRLKSNLHHMQRKYLAMFVQGADQMITRLKCDDTQKSVNTYNCARNPNWNRNCSYQENIFHSYATRYILIKKRVITKIYINNSKLNIRIGTLNTVKYCHCQGVCLYLYAFL